MSYNNWTVSKLKAELRKRGLRVSGRKNELIGRLVDDDGQSRSSSSSSEVVAKPRRSRRVQTRRTTVRKQKSLSLTLTSSGSSSSVSEEVTVTKSVVKKKTNTVGKPVDKFFCKKYAPSGTVDAEFSITLNQTNITRGRNNNKFYYLQVVASGSDYYCYSRYGRLGYDGQTTCKGPFGKEKAIAQFKTLFYKKTKNRWDERDNFVKHDGQYDIIDLAEDDDNVDDIEDTLKSMSGKKKVKRKTADCTLPKETQDLLRLILDNDMFREQMKDLDIDVTQLPLGKLSKAQIEKGFKVLKQLSAAINAGNANKAEDLSARFYTVIPHSFGRSVPPPIRTQEALKKKNDMLNVLQDISYAKTLLDEQDKNRGDVDEDKELPHELDVQYELLNCNIHPVAQDTEEYQVIADYLDATMNKRRPLVLEQLYKIDRIGEDERFAEWEDVGNRKLLWHGTNVAVIAAILKTGLRIMPHSGGRVGRGLYFASENSKSANYVTCAGRTGIMFLNEVVLGKEHTIIRDDSSLKKAPKGYDSIVARGHTEPDPTHDTTLTLDGKEVVVPQGVPKQVKQYAKSNFTQSEYLVYNESQNRIRYLLKLRF